MFRYEQLISGLQLMAEHSRSGTVDVSAEHDVIYAGPADERGDFVEQSARLVALGWHRSDELECWAFFT